MRSLHPFFLLVFLLFSGFSSTASVFNDTPCTADDMGVLDTATTCPFSSGGVPLTRFSQSNFGATAEPLQPALMNCQGTTADMPTQSKDLWYKFRVRAHSLNVIMIGSISTPFIALYQYTGNCMSMVPVDCAKGSAGYINTDFYGLVPGMEYYLQVGGSTTSDVGTFSLAISNSNVCLSCSKDEILFVDHAPINGFYNTGDTVNFCFVVNGFKRFNNNSLHGIVPIMAAGWNPSVIYYPVTRTSTAPGTWLSGYMYNGLPFALGNQRGFFFDGPASNTTPIDNLGDPGGVNDRWVFCWQAVANTCPSNQDMGISIYTFSDGETGTGPQPGCIADRKVHFSAKLNCCGSMRADVTTTSCATTCNAGAQVQITPNVTSFPPLYYYGWFDQAGNMINTSVPSIPQYSDTLTGLCKGDYNVIVTNTAQNCFVAKGFNVKTAFTVDAQQLTFSCGSTNFVSAIANVTSTNTYTFSWSNGNTNQTASNLFCGQTYVVYVTANSCTITDTIHMELLPYSDPFFTYPSAYLTKCTGSPQFIFPLYIATPGGTFSSGTPGLVNSSTGAIDMSIAVISNSYQITYVSPPPCTGTHIVTITIIGQDLSYFHYPDSVVCAAKYDNVLPDTVASYGGVFTSTGGLNVDSASGIISPPYLPGTYTITYNSPNQGPCHTSHTFIFYVHDIPPTPQGPSNGYTYCPGDPTVTMTATLTPACSTCAINWFSDITFTTLLAANTPTYTANTNQQSPLVFYLVTYDIATGCFSNGSVIYVTMAPYPNVQSSSSDTVICPGFDGSLHATHDPNYQYSWDPSTGLNDPSIPDPTFNLNTTTTFTVYVTDVTTGCNSSCVITINVDSTGNCDTLIFYHGFTPNGDFHNDGWVIDGINKYPKNRVSIFTRWGEKVWETNDYDNRSKVFEGNNQKGTPLVAGTYFYVVEIPDRPSEKGWVEVSR